MPIIPQEEWNDGKVAQAVPDTPILAAWANDALQRILNRTQYLYAWVGQVLQRLVQHEGRTDNPHGTTAEQVGAVRNGGGVPTIQAGLLASRPSPGTPGRLYLAHDTGQLFRDDGSAWAVVATVQWQDLQGKPSTFPPSPHTHPGSDITSPVAQAQTADRWTTARTLALTGPVTGSASVDGSANASIATSISAGAVGTTQLADGAITLPKIAPTILGTADGLATLDANGRLNQAPKDGAIQTAHLADEAVTPAKTSFYLAGTLAGRPAPGIADRLYWATDQNRLYRDDGTAWQEVKVTLADQWSTPRTLALSGAVQGSAQMDGSANISLQALVPAGTTAPTDPAPDGSLYLENSATPRLWVRVGGQWKSAALS